MGPIPPDKSWDEIDRETIEEIRRRRAASSGEPSIPGERMHAFLVELDRRCTEAGNADPAVVQELLGKLKRGEQF